MADTYQEIPWRGMAIEGSAPEQLAVCSWLHGGPATTGDGGSVLELGCGDGANLLPMAWYRPGWRFVGIDADGSSLASAREGMRRLGVRNLELIHSDLRRVALGDRRFEVIIAAGVFSWVSPDAREALLALLGRHLAPLGLAFVSFNAQPGWSLRGLVRDVLLRAGIADGEVRERAVRARALCAGLRRALPAVSSPYTALLERELGRVEGAADDYVVHEYLGADNRAFWFGEFCELAAWHGLRHVGDARFNRAEGLPAAELRERLRAAGGVTMNEDEAVDLIGGRQFRHALLCRREAPASDPSRCVHGATIATALARVSDPFRLAPGCSERFQGADGFAVDVTDPRLKWALHLAAQWPAGRTLSQLGVEGRRALGDLGLVVDWSEPELSRLGEGLTQLCRLGQVELRLREPHSRVEVSERPAAIALARYEAEHGRALTTPFHTLLPLEPHEQQLVARLDGSTLPPAVVRCADRPGAGLRSSAPPDEHNLATLQRLGWWGLLEP